MKIYVVIELYDSNMPVAFTNKKSAYACLRHREKHMPREEWTVLEIDLYTNIQDARKGSIYSI